MFTLLRTARLATSRRTLCNLSRRPVSFFDKDDVYIDPAKKKIRKSNMSTKVVIVLVAVSWIVIFKLWFGVQDEVKLRAQKYYEEGGKMDQALSEEYRPEYVQLQSQTIFDDPTSVLDRKAEDEVPCGRKGREGEENQIINRVQILDLKPQAQTGKKNDGGHTRIPKGGNMHKARTCSQLEVELLYEEMIYV